MAKGDMVNLLVAFSGSYAYYQPAAGVEVMFLSVATNNDSNIWRTDGVVSSGNIIWTNLNYTGGAGASGAVNMKFGATNGVYVGVYGSTKTHTGLTGVQTK